MDLESDRSPQRVKLSTKKQQVRYFHRLQTYRKSRSARTTRHEKKIRIKVDTSQPSEPYVEPVCYVKLGLKHKVAVFYTGTFLRCDSTSYCNELCDYICGGINRTKNEKGAQYKDTEYKSELTFLRPKSLSCDSGIYDCFPYDENDIPVFLTDNEFINIDVHHRSVWFCQLAPVEQKFVISSFYPQSESATETECSGPSSNLCFRWHKDLERSATNVKKKKSIMKSPAGVRTRAKSHSGCSMKSLSSDPRDVVTRRSSEVVEENLEPHPSVLNKSLFDYNLKTKTIESVRDDDSRNAVECRKLQETYTSVLSAIRSTSRSEKRKKATSLSFRIDL